MSSYMTYLILGGGAGPACSAGTPASPAPCSSAKAEVEATGSEAMISRLVAVACVYESERKVNLQSLDQVAFPPGRLPLSSAFHAVVNKSHCETGKHDRLSQWCYCRTLGYSHVVLRQGRRNATGIWRYLVVSLQDVC